MDAAYRYCLLQITSHYLKKAFPSTGLKPHFLMSVNKSTCHRDTNHAILIIMPVNGRRVAVPMDAPLVYKIDDEGDITEGSGVDLAHQSVESVKKNLEFESKDLSYIRVKILFH